MLRSTALSVAPGREFIEPGDLVVGDAAEHVDEPGLRDDAVELGSEEKVSGRKRCQEKVSGTVSSRGKDVRPLRARAEVARAVVADRPASSFGRKEKVSKEKVSGPFLRERMRRAVVADRQAKVSGTFFG